MHPKIKMLHELIKMMDKHEGERIKKPKHAEVSMIEMEKPEMPDAPTKMEHPHMEESSDDSFPEDPEEKKAAILKMLGR